MWLLGGPGGLYIEHGTHNKGYGAYFPQTVANNLTLVALDSKVDPCNTFVQYNAGFLWVNRCKLLCFNLTKDKTVKHFSHHGAVRFGENLTCQVRIWGEGGGGGCRCLESGHPPFGPRCRLFNTGPKSWPPPFCV